MCVANFDTFLNNESKNKEQRTKNKQQRINDSGRLSSPQEDIFAYKFADNYLDCFELATTIPEQHYLTFPYKRY